MPHEPAETVVMPAPEAPKADQRALGIGRLVAGALQGVVLYALYLSSDDKTWPSTDPYWMAPLLMVFVFVPLLFLQALGAVRGRTLMLWTAAATVLLALLAWHDIGRQWEPTGWGSQGDGAMTFALVAFSIIGLFIAQSLISAGDSERKYVASYAAYFDDAWKLAVQLVLAAAFVGVFWGVLWLGSALFHLIKLEFLRTLIEKAWFAIPATTLATAAALHITDMQARLVAGVRTVALTLLSWLLPLMTLIATGFTFMLFFTGLEPLRATTSTASLLLAVAGMLVILINAAFQDGDPARARPAVLRYAEAIAALILVPIVVIAAYALWLRVRQYGWTVERIGTAATVVVALCYAFGYATAALLSLLGGAWMSLVARVNVITAFVVLAILLIIFTPIGDPARLAVDSQVGRLKAGTVSATAFDYNYLKAEGGRYGRAALNDLIKGDFGASTVTVRKLAKAALEGTYVPPPAPPPPDIARNVTVYPAGRTLPRGMIEHGWRQDDSVPICLTMAKATCEAFFADLDGDGTDEVILADGTDAYWSGTIYKLGPDHAWKLVATMNGQCPGVLEALREGRAAIGPASPPLHDLVVAGVTLHPQMQIPPSPPCP